MSADGGISERLIDADVIDRLVWTPDGRRIVFAVTMGNAPALQAVTVADGQVEPIRTPDLRHFHSDSKTTRWATWSRWQEGRPLRI